MIKHMNVNNSISLMWSFMETSKRDTQAHWTCVNYVSDIILEMAYVRSHKSSFFGSPTVPLSTSKQRQLHPLKSDGQTSLHTACQPLHKDPV